jgi:hypothetical protein
VTAARNFSAAKTSGTATVIAKHTDTAKQFAKPLQIVLIFSLLFFVNWLKKEPHFV